jgi:hypothetical protein
LRFVVTITAALALAGLTLLAADLTGTWSGTFEVRRSDGSSRTLTPLVILKQDGTVLTGSIGSNQSDQRPIRNGKVDGDRVTFEIESQGGTIQRFDLKASADRIEGDVRASTHRAAKRVPLVI